MEKNEATEQLIIGSIIFVVILIAAYFLLEKKPATAPAPVSAPAIINFHAAAPTAQSVTTQPQTIQPQNNSNIGPGASNVIAGVAGLLTGYLSSQDNPDDNHDTYGGFSLEPGQVLM